MEKYEIKRCIVRAYNLAIKLCLICHVQKPCSTLSIIPTKTFVLSNEYFKGKAEVYSNYFVTPACRFCHYSFSQSKRSFSQFPLILFCLAQAKKRLGKIRCEMNFVPHQYKIIVLSINFQSIDDISFFTSITTLSYPQRRLLFALF